MAYVGITVIVKLAVVMAVPKSNEGIQGTEYFDTGIEFYLPSHLSTFRKVVTYI